MRIPIVPFGVNCVVTAKDSEPVIFCICPRRAAMSNRFGEKHQRAGRAGIGVPEWRIGVLNAWGSGVYSLMAGSDEQRATLVLLLPD